MSQRGAVNMPRRSVDETVLGERMQGPDECGLFLLASVESEAAAAMGYGPAATGWPRWAASRWHFGHIIS